MDLDPQIPVTIDCLEMNPLQIPRASCIVSVHICMVPRQKQREEIIVVYIGASPTEVSGVYFQVVRNRTMLYVSEQDEGNK